MHLPDGILQAHLAQGLQFVGALSLSYSIRRSFQEDKGDLRSTLRMVVGAACIFLVQTFTTPGGTLVPPHLLGAFALCLILGPGVAGVITASVVLLQALGFGDGSTATLGANYVLMGVIPVYTGLLIFDWLRQSGKGTAWSTASAGLSGTVSVVFSALFLGVLASMGRGTPVGEGLRDALSGYALTALLEGALTALLFAILTYRYPNALHPRFRAE